MLKILDYLIDYKLNDFMGREVIKTSRMNKIAFYKYFEG